MQRDSSDSDDGLDSSGDERLATLANKADVEDKSGFKFCNIQTCILYTFILLYML